MAPSETPDPDLFLKIEAAIDREVAEDALPIPDRSRRIPLTIATVAATVLVGILIFRFVSHPPVRTHAAVAHLERLGPGSTFYRIQDDRKESLQPGATFAAGEEITTDAGAAAVFRIDGVGRFRVSGGSHLRIESSRKLRLESGEVIAEVTPGGRGFEIETPAARATVQGTVFRVAVEATRTSLLVARGKVMFSTAQKSVAVTQGCQAFADEGQAPSDALVLDASSADWRLFDSLLAPPRLHLTLTPASKAGTASFEVALRSESETKCDVEMSQQTYLILVLTDAQGRTELRRVSSGGLEIRGARERGLARVNSASGVDFSGALAGLAPGRWSATAHYASGGREDSWAGFAESGPVSFEISK